MRKTEITHYGQTAPTTRQLNAVWNLIEDRFEEEWRMEYNGAITFEVSEALLAAHGLPDYLCGAYTIKGVYDDRQRFINGKRTYYFEQA